MSMDAEHLKGMGQIKTTHALILTAIIGLTAGYIAAPDLLPMLRYTLTDTPVEAVTASSESEPEEEDWTDDWPEDYDAPELNDDEQEETDSFFDTVTEATELAVADDEADACDFPEIVRIAAETDDPDGNNTTPCSITTYQPRKPAYGTGQGAGAGKTQQWFKEKAFTGQRFRSAWRYPSILKRRIVSYVRSRLKGTDQQSVEMLLKDPEIRLMIAQWELLSKCDSDKLADLMRNTKVRTMLSPLLNDLPWMSSFVYDGELENGEIVLSILAHLCQVDPNMSKEVIIDGVTPNPWLKRRVAGAIAAEFGRLGLYGGDTQELSRKEAALMRKAGYVLPTLPGIRNRGREKRDVYRAARERYLYYAESIDKGLLHTGFWDLPDWLLRYVCRWDGVGKFGTPSTMRWLRDNCAAPVEAYLTMFRQVPRRPTNAYGDPIESEWYYQPYDVLYPGNFAKETRDVGATSKGESHFAAAAACAYGVPAIVGVEPDNYSYAVFHNGEWKTSNTRWGMCRRCMKHPIGGTYKWYALTNQAEMFKAGDITRDAQMVFSLACMLAENENPESSIALFELSLQMQSLYDNIWGKYLDMAVKTLNDHPRRWLGINEFTCKALARTAPETCAKLLERKVYPGMLKVLRSPKQKLAAYEHYFRNVYEGEDNEITYQGLLDYQYRELGKANAIKMQYMQMVVDTFAQKSGLASWVSWAVTTSHRENKALHRNVIKMIETALEAHPEQKDKISGGIIRGAEEIGDMELANKWSADYLNPGVNLPYFEPPGGKLISAGGLIRLSRYSSLAIHNLYHAAALTENGGDIYVKADQLSIVTLELPKKQRIGCIVLIAKDQLSHKGQITIELSNDGTNWTHFVELSPEESRQNIARVEQTKNTPSAKFIRLTNKSTKPGATTHLKAFLVYDNKKVK